MSCWRVSILDTCRLAPPTFAPTPAAAGFSRYAAVNAEGAYLVTRKKWAGKEGQASTLSTGSITPFLSNSPRTPKLYLRIRVNRSALYVDQSQVLLEQV